MIFAGTGKVCTDIDECRVGTHTCHENGICTNTVGSYTCKCQTGYNGKCQHLFLSQTNNSRFQNILFELCKLEL